jgi:hypothetical protein
VVDTERGVEAEADQSGCEHRSCSTDAGRAVHDDTPSSGELCDDRLGGSGDLQPLAVWIFWPAVAYEVLEVSSPAKVEWKRIVGRPRMGQADDCTESAVPKFLPVDSRPARVGHSGERRRPLEYPVEVVWDLNARRMVKPESMAALGQQGGNTRDRNRPRRSTDEGV